MEEVWWRSKSCRLISMMALTSSFFLVELVVGNITNSIALVADSFHMLSDIIALVVGLAAVLIAEKKTAKNTFGWQRAEVLGALVNSVFLVSLCFTIVIDSLKRFFEEEKVSNPKVVLIVGGVGFAINAVGLFLLRSHGIGHGHSHNLQSKQHAHRHTSTAPILADGNSDTPVAITGSETINGSAKNNSVHDVGVDLHAEGTDEEDVFVTNGSAHLNMRGVFLHVLGDALGSVVVMISATLIMCFEEGSYWVVYVDPALSLIIVVIICSSTLPLLWQSSMILLLSIPQDVNMNELIEEIMELPSVRNIHDLHIWQLAGDKNIFTAHVCFSSQDGYIQGERSIKDILHKKGIHSSTIQPEFETSERHSSTGSFDEESCLLKCDSQKCQANTCCASRKTSIKQSSSSTPPADSPPKKNQWLKGKLRSIVGKDKNFGPL